VTGPTGQVRAAGDIIRYFSDIRLKDNISNIDNPGKKLYSLNGVFYNQNELAKKYGFEDFSRNIGVIAQEVEKVLPESVSPAPFDIDENEKSKSGYNFLTVDYENLIPLIVETIKEQQKEIDYLKEILK
jgi:hypothetical protein